MQTKATSTHGLTVTTTATGGQNKRRGILLASLASHGFTLPADVSNAAVIACHNTARRKARHENPYLGTVWELNRRTPHARRIIIVGHGENFITASDEHNRIREAMELEEIADELERLEIESRPQSGEPISSREPKPRQKAAPKNPAPVLEPKPQPVDFLAAIAALKMPR